jgi:hypothetical protein
MGSHRGVGAPWKRNSLLNSTRPYLSHPFDKEDNKKHQSQILGSSLIVHGHDTSVFTLIFLRLYEVQMATNALVRIAACDKLRREVRVCRQRTIFPEPIKPVRKGFEVKYEKQRATQGVTAVTV